MCHEKETKIEPQTNMAQKKAPYLSQSLANPTAMISQRTNLLLKDYLHNIIRYFNTFSKLFAQQRGLLNEGCFLTNYSFTILYNNIL